MLDDSEYTPARAGRPERVVPAWNDELLPEEPFTFHFIKFKSGSPELIESRHGSPRVDAFG